MIPYLISMMIQVIGNIILSIIVFIFLPLHMFASACISLSTYELCRLFSYTVHYKKKSRLPGGEGLVHDIVEHRR